MEKEGSTETYRQKQFCSILNQKSRDDAQIIYTPIPPKQKMKFIIIALLLIPFAAGTSSAEQESSKLSSDGMHRLRALVVDEGSMPADFYSLSVNGEVEGISAASKTSVQSMRSATSYLQYVLTLNLSMSQVVSLLMF